MKYYFRCPKCGNDEQFVKPSYEQNNFGIGLVPGLILAGQNHRRIQCTRCTHLFLQPSLPSSPLGRFAGWIIALTILPIIIAGFVVSVDDLGGQLPSLPVVDIIEEAVGRHPRVAAYLIASLIPLIVIPAWLFALVSNFKFHKQVAKEYNVKALSPRELAEQLSVRTDIKNEDP